ncbi:TonB-dependent hemoglobin/transferrin/lactoferrin family receptor [Oricola thermophila]|uniref:TonB-dependent hemoglobin/transferrin/lactoferrin family receptor n=1 Tax=Oricola thermophila TaxID=2742145 RepID=A0A6N1VHE0_9HYPH|nr:TonB-dependent hemoglobin/transferrin/lactoferrin family receptor [Oricola thermophila]QKV20376.1 TonB-dependent hemoglobin/transferrin/lactoferrin family receptor [Oricola thermophila]
MASSAVAQEDVVDSGQPTLLQRLILLGKEREAGSVAGTPLATQTTDEEIERNQIDSIVDLGNTTEPGIGTGAAGRGVNIRGLEADRILTTIDGIPIPFLVNDARSGVNSADGGVDTFDFSSLSTVDIVRGADSSRAGSGALGGAVVLRTLEPGDLLEEDDNFGGIARTTYDSRDQSIGGVVAIAGRRNDTSVLLQAGYTRGHEMDNQGTVGGTGAGRSQPNPVDYDEHNLLFKIRQDVGAGHMVGLTAERFRNDSSTDLFTEEGSTYSELDGEDVNERNRVSIDYRYEAPIPGALVDRADAKLYWQRLQSFAGVEGVRVDSLAGDWMRGNDLTENAVGFTGAAERSLEVGASTHLLSVGLDMSLSRFEQYSSGDDACDTISPPPFACMFYHNNKSDMPDIDAYRVGLFVDDEISFGDSGFSLTPGLRYDWYDYKPRDTADFPGTLPKERSDYQFSPKLRAGYRVDPGLQLFAQWSMAFKAPNVSQLYLNYDNAPFYRSIGNPDLEPETSHGFEVGANFGDEDQGGRITAFYNKYRNFIDSETSYTVPGYSFSTTYENLDRVEIYGFEAELHKRFENGFSLSGAFALAHGKDEDTGDLIDSVAPLKAVVGIGYETETWGTDARLIGVAPVDAESPAAFKPDGYAIVNLTGWWEPENLNGFRLSGGVYNLFDTEYYDAVKWRDLDLTSSSAQPMAYYSEPGRTFKVTLTQRF